MRVILQCAVKEALQVRPAERDDGLPRLFYQRFVGALGAHDRVRLRRNANDLRKRLDERNDLRIGVHCQMLGFAKAIEEAGRGPPLALVVARERVAKDRRNRRDQLPDAGAIGIPTGNERRDMGDRLRLLRVESGF